MRVEGTPVWIEDQFTEEQMPTYEWINKETGEITSNYMAISALDKYKEEILNLKDISGTRTSTLSTANRSKQMDSSK